MIILYAIISSMQNMIKNKRTVAYRLFAAFYDLFSLLPAGKKDVFFVMTHSSSGEDNCGVVLNALRSKGYRITTLTKDSRSFRPFSLKALRFFVVLPYKAARSRTLFLDNAFLPLAFCRIPKDRRICMLWHGTGTIKKFGILTSEEPLRSIEAASYQKITHLFVASEYTRDLYTQCFGLPADRVLVTGCPRCDRLFDHICSQGSFPVTSSQEFKVLYAPTFREDQAPSEMFVRLVSLLALLRASGRNIRLLLRLHPYIAANFQNVIDPAEHPGFTDVSSRTDLNSLLIESDMLVTDYSSVCYDFMILQKPVVFFPYDLKHYEEDERGFFEKYSDLVPGKVFLTPEALADAIIELSNVPSKPDDRYNLFFDKAFRYKDSDSTKRILEILDL